jgi:hypothetical protein
VAPGRLYGCSERGIWPWDLAAGSVILEEAWGKLTSYRGDFLDLDGREIVASNGHLHPAMIELAGEDGRGGRLVLLNYFRRNSLLRAAECIRASSTRVEEPN